MKKRQKKRKQIPLLKFEKKILNLRGPPPPPPLILFFFSPKTIRIKMKKNF